MAGRRAVLRCPHPTAAISITHTIAMDEQRNASTFIPAFTFLFTPLLAAPVRSESMHSCASITAACAHTLRNDVSAAILRIRITKTILLLGVF